MNSSPQRPDLPPDLRTLPDELLAPTLGVSLGHLKNKRPIPAFKVGKSWRTLVSDVLIYIEGQRQTTRKDKLTGDLVDIKTGKVVGHEPITEAEIRRSERARKAAAARWARVHNRGVAPSAETTA